MNFGLFGVHRGYDRGSILLPLSLNRQKVMDTQEWRSGYMEPRMYDESHGKF